MNREAWQISTDIAPGSMAPEVVPVRQSDPVGNHPGDAPPLDPQRIVPHVTSRRRGAAATAILSALVLHGGFAALLALLLNWRTIESQPEHAVPVEIVASMPEMPKPQHPEPPPPPAPAASPAPAPAAPPPPASSAVPPPFVAPPPEPKRAETEPTPPKTIVPDAPPKPEPHQPAAAPPRDAPAVLTSPQGGFAVAPSAPAQPTPRPPAPAPSQPDPSAVLAQALPLDLSGLPSTFRAVLSGPGSQSADEYKGLVYGQIQRSHRAMEEAAARHLKGQVVVAFSVGADGHADDLKIARSSGTAALDALGLDMVREAEPFPPPPPGAAQVFTPVFAFGRD